VAVRYVHIVKSISLLARRYVYDGLIALLAAVGLLEVAVRRGDPDAPQSTFWFIVPATALLVIAIVARRRLPFAAPTGYWLLAAAISFVDWRLIPFMNSFIVIGMTVAFLLGNLRDARQGAIGLACILGATGTLVYNIPGHSAANLVFIPLEFGISWLAGFAVRERAEKAEAAEERATRAEQDRETAARIAVAEERARIARELHDVVAHAVSVMVLQVGAVRHKLPDALAEDRGAPSGVEWAGRTALTEMRRLLAAMRSDGDEAEFTPQPGLDCLESLADDIGHAGLPVQVHLDGEPFPLPRAIDLSAYRIVQEGLTNALKHAHATNADVTVGYRQDELQLEIRDNGAGGPASDSLGHGLLGIRERVKIFGGQMSAGPARAGGFMLSARLPVSGNRA
jgi:signal transduction histidine kinase